MIDLVERGIAVGATISSVVIISEGEEQEIEHKAKMQEVAKIIIGDNAVPAWLCDLLSDWSFEVKSSHSIEALLPTKKELSNGQLLGYLLFNWMWVVIRGVRKISPSSPCVGVI
jgi:hypothetical protein